MRNKISETAPDNTSLNAQFLVEGHRLLLKDKRKYSWKNKNHKFPTGVEIICFKFNFFKNCFFLNKSGNSKVS